MSLIHCGSRYSCLFETLDIFIDIPFIFSDLFFEVDFLFGFYLLWVSFASQPRQCGLASETSSYAKIPNFFCYFVACYCFPNIVRPGGVALVPIKGLGTPFLLCLVHLSQVCCHMLANPRNLLSSCHALSTSWSFGSISLLDC